MTAIFPDAMPRDAESDGTESDDERARAWNQAIERRTHEVFTGTVELLDGQQVHDELRARLDAIADTRG